MDAVGGQPAAARYAYVSLGLVVGTISVGSHLLADVITPAGITPFWPVSSRHYSMNLVSSDSLVANWSLLGAGVAMTGGLVVAFAGG
ncbi:metal-dependent hydrolase [Haloarculaceae archaeon H-GB2-1]|nr:metal-dependent hydrolase [Haloarculaceae archaeon H-GB11]MEA5408032.1 metal-dependent hydrolase [Haloarculaceae archaeon H-GB2-1]